MRFLFKFFLVIIAIIGIYFISAKKLDNGEEKRQEEKAIADSSICFLKIVDATKEDLQLYWKDDKGEILKSINNLKNYIATKNKQLIFAMNAGMYLTDNSPQGLFIQNGHIKKQSNLDSGFGNFYWKPNGVFYITKNKRAVVCTTKDYIQTDFINFATQSGPMLVIDGKIHDDFKQGSQKLNVRNGVGILPDGKILFAMSKQEINMYDFAKFFLERGCKNALYLDGFVSRMYLPEQNCMQLDGNFGVMIGIVE